MRDGRVLSQLGFIAAYAVAGPLSDHVFNPLLEEGGLLASSIGRFLASSRGGASDFCSSSPAYWSSRWPV